MNVNLYIDGKPVVLEDVARRTEELSFTLGGTAYTFRCHRLPDNRSLLEREIAPGIWQRISGTAWQSGKERRVRLGGIEAKVAELTANSATDSIQDLSPKAPMPGLVRQILVKIGEHVKQGQALAVMEAMKLQITLSAGDEATVEEILVREGELIAEGTELVRLAARAGENA